MDKIILSIILGGYVIISIIKINNISKVYCDGENNQFKILDNINFEVNSGDFSVILGESGAGKSTFMNIIGLLDKPTSGEYILDGTDINAINIKNLSKLRNQKIGFIFQNFNLISNLNAISNVELPMKYAKISPKLRTEKAEMLLNMVGMSNRLYHFPNELSGGQKQRVAIARALANDPAIILADEPTGALDSKTSKVIMDIFHKLNKNYEKTIVLITHNLNIIEKTDKIFIMKDGKITPSIR